MIYVVPRVNLSRRTLQCRVRHFTPTYDMTKALQEILFVPKVTVFLVSTVKFICILCSNIYSTLKNIFHKRKVKIVYHFKYYTDIYS